MLCEMTHPEFVKLIPFDRGDIFWTHLELLRKCKFVPYHCISLIYFSFTKIRMFLYARIYWLAEFGDVSCLQFNYLRVETLTPTWEDFVGQFGRCHGRYIQ
jgi:hypothetical protein